ncbi:flagellar export protein FliJ [Vibrio hepatarius]|uniref:flagellar export protein FliJ n=1 Tax=Vibrio hepatarius TaxID=171383 RepID=UPI00142DD3AD|nr:flagellar export protein FliJ [Vibrio hepatarius]NIY83674.1 flagellar export protein FliJ [Vibrio hepatarius]
MDTKLKAVGRIQQIEEKQRDCVGRQLESMRQHHTHLKQQLSQLADLKKHSGQTALMAPSLNSAILMNLNSVNQMLQKMLVHHENEQAVMQAQCFSVQKVLEQKHARVQMLEKAFELVRAKQKHETARKEQKLFEDIINCRFNRKAL